MIDTSLKERIKHTARALGFNEVGIARLSDTHEAEQQLKRWQALGFAGEMRYMQEFFTRQAGLKERFPEARTAIVVAVNYYADGDTPPAEGQGKIARYARGKDYHKVIQKRLQALADRIQVLVPQSTHLVPYVDTGPVLERELARLAGIGFVGKNTTVITERFGSWVFLGELLTDLDLEPDAPLPFDCGSCTRCLDACPTEALVEPHLLDARRCISYLTIELREAIHERFHQAIGDWLFGCDVCQEVCPFNQHPQETQWETLQPQAGVGATINLATLQDVVDDEVFREQFRGTPLLRAQRSGLLRNAKVVAANNKQRFNARVVMH